MTKKDYIAIARAIASVLETPEPERHNNTRESACADIAIALADVCKSDNPRFDKERFLKACKI